MRYPEPPGLRAVQRWLKAWRADSSNARALSAVSDPDGHRSRRAPALGNRAVGVDAPNALWELDSTPADVMCLDGRHQIVGAIDVWSRRVKLLVVPVSRTTAICALLRRCLIDWGVPSLVRTDEGRDYTSAHLARVLADLGVTHDVCPPYTPDAKPYIERMLGTLTRDLFAFLPGFTGHNVADRKKTGGAPFDGAAPGRGCAGDLWCRSDERATSGEMRRLVRGRLWPPGPFRDRAKSISADEQLDCLAQAPRRSARA
ncbi:integrase catalytic domain-containing protein [Tateyamaria sp.]|uniref:integrase catalytic domain-containing protein n=1 Tax=Tateyamaria sp. TaxID=1929288 RepID=UPI003B2177AC